MFGPHDAFLLLHWQNEVVDPQGTIGSRGGGAAILADGTFDVLERALDAAGAAGTPIIHVVFSANEDGTCRSAAAQPACLARDRLRARLVGAQVPDRLRRPGDEVVVHDTMSALAGTGLTERLRDSALDRLVLCGVSTLLVVAATASPPSTRASTSPCWRTAVSADPRGPAERLGHSGSSRRSRPLTRHLPVERSAF